MKRVLLFLIPALVFTSCNKMLDEDVRSQAPYDYLNTPSGFEDAVRAAYSSLRNYYGQERGMTLTVFGTDTYTNGADGSFKYVNQYTPNLDARVSIIREIWNEFYIAINTCNTVIDMASQVQGITDKTRAIRVAEARFLRAHYYFVLAQMFGPIPLPLKANRSVITEATRQPLASVYNAITSDLEMAIKDLEIKPVDYGRATKPAAEHRNINFGYTFPEALAKRMRMKSTRVYLSMLQPAIYARYRQKEKGIDPEYPTVNTPATSMISFGINTKF